MSACTLIRLEGPDALDLLHRISTQHLRDLTPGTCRTTLFCDFRGRVQHRAAVACTASGVAWLVRSDAAGAELFAQVDRQLFRDRVAMEDWSGRQPVVETRSSEGAVIESLEQRGGIPSRLHLAGGIDLVVGGDTEIAPLDDITRIRLGAPRHGHEIRDEFNALEAGLARDVHLDKGCFTGQEALLRLITYGGVRRLLARLEGEIPAPAPGDSLKQNDAIVGRVTSVAIDGTSWSALAVVRRDALAEGIEVAGDSGAQVLRVAAFPEVRPLGLPETPAK